ncbi:hypothetical protein ACTWQB_05715 [Piscibacillus sp. B03]|uniref:hypothetical protein n=1 Tax=Piscibacillus sp. B03 TaxID=3457430 RepID=UPI003FCD3A59
MFWNYLKLESKIAFTSKKNLMLALIIILFFPIVFVQQLQDDSVSLKDLKDHELTMATNAVYYLENIPNPTPEEQQVLDNSLQQLSSLGYQKYYISNALSLDEMEFIDEGIKLNEQRLKNHELDNAGIPPEYIIPKEDILIEQQKLQYLQEHQLPLEPEPTTMSSFSATAMSNFSVLFVLLLIIIGSDLLTFEKRHDSILKALPISFSKKIFIKICVYSFISFIAISMGLFAGNAIAYFHSGVGNFQNPIVIFSDGQFEVIQTTQFMVQVGISIILITLMILTISILLNLLFNNAFANIGIGIIVFIFPLLFASYLQNWNWLHFLIFVDYSGTLLGEHANNLTNSNLTYTASYAWIASLTVISFILIYIKQNSYYLKEILLKTFNRSYGQ